MVTLDESARFSHARRAMVRDQIQARGVRDEGVLEALRTLPREFFVPAQYHDLSYADRRPTPCRQVLTS